MISGEILLTRHAERPSDPLDPDLSPAGYARAQQLPAFIQSTFGYPDFLFASAISKHSRRPWETIQPLSKACGVPIDASFADQDYEALAYELLTKPRYEGKRTLVCWHHGHIPSFAHALGAKQGSYPDPWDPKVFNLILKLSFGGSSPQVQLVTEPF
jgi:broad specificity phosphatase PhoE